MKSDFIIALTQLAAERHLPRESVLSAIEAALASAFKKDSIAAGHDLSVKLNPNTGEVKIYALKTVVEKAEDLRREISLEQARRLKPDVQLSEEIPLEADSVQTSRIAAQTAKQVVLQRLREAERELIYEEFTNRVDDILSGTVSQVERDTGRIILDLGNRAEAALPQEEQSIADEYRKGLRIRVYVLEVARTVKGPEIVVSRTHRGLLRRLLELEVPEIFNGIVEVKSIAREAGSRSKVAVTARQEGVDPVGSCIGVRGNRIQTIMRELQGERIDVVHWHKDPAAFIASALSPTDVQQVALDAEEKKALVVVPDRLLSLAIGKDGQNARLAAKLTGWHLDIKSVAEWEEMRGDWEAEQAAKKKDKTVLKTVEVADISQEETEVGVAVIADAVEVAVSSHEEVEHGVESFADLEGGIEEKLAESSVAADVEEDEEVGLEISEEVWKLPETPQESSSQIRFAEEIAGVAPRGKGREKRGGRGVDNDRKGGRKSKIYAHQTSEDDMEDPDEVL